ncbi:MAG: glutaredoxin family protein [Thermoplasmatota archaeon]
MCTWMKEVQGKDKGDVKLYALSTCIFCMRTKRLLDKLGVAYRYVDIDELDGGDQDEAVDQMREHNPSGGFPTIIINGTVIQGYKEDQIKEALDHAA